MGNLNSFLVAVDSGLSARLIGPFMVDRLLPQAPDGSSVPPTLEEIENPCHDPNLHSTFLCDRIGTLESCDADILCVCIATVWLAPTRRAVYTADDPNSIR